MGNIDVIGKWELDKGEWNGLPLREQFGRSLVLVNYEKIINDIEQGIDYVILAYGTRLENHSKKCNGFRESVMGVDKVISYFKDRNKNVVIQLLLLDADAPLIEESKFLAKHIDLLSMLPKTNSVNLIGLSKCGAMAFYVPKYFVNPESYNKTNIYTVATPFDGTKMASPKLFYPELKQFVFSKLGDNKLSNIVYNGLVSIYDGELSDSHMDYDIAVLGGVPEEKIHLYDESFIKNIFSMENIKAIKKISNYRNFVTGIDDKTFGEALRTMNFSGIGLCILNNYFFEGKSDGMVMTESQRLVESKIELLDFKSYILSSSHHHVTSNNRVFNNLLHIVNDTIDEHTEKVKYRARIRRK